MTQNGQKLDAFLPNGERSRGGVALARKCVSRAEVAQKIGVSESLVGKWMSGQRRPSFEDRVAIARAYDIPAEWWDQRPTNDDPAIPPEPSTNGGHVASAGGTMEQKERLAALNGMISQMYHDLRKPEAAQGKERAVILSRLAEAEMKVGKLTGESLEMPEEKIVKLPGFRRVLTKVLDVLQYYPEAAAKVLEALRDLQ